MKAGMENDSSDSSQIHKYATRGKKTKENSKMNTNESQRSNKKCKGEPKEEKEICNDKHNDCEEKFDSEESDNNESGSNDQYDDDTQSDDDSDYDPDASESEDDEEDVDDEETADSGEFEDEPESGMPNVHIFNPSGSHQMLFIIPQPPPPPRAPPHARESSPCEHHEPQRKRMRGEEYAFTQYFTPQEKGFWRNLDESKKVEYMTEAKKIKDVHNNDMMPWRFKFLSSDVDVATKAIIMAKLDQFQQMHEGSGEYYKLRNWLNCAVRLPLGKYFPLPVTPSDPFSKVAEFLRTSRNTLDGKVFGHTDAKNQIMRIFAQWVANPHSKGHCIGIQGPAGVGKTSLVKEGICKALGLPFGFVALGGASDGSFLEGHSFTYEGSTHGKIAEILMKTQCMNPIMFFDELDKVSSTSRGEEIIGILTHLTDSTQNERFQDRYFGGLELNLSRALIIFSYNDETKINHILKDRMITINVKGYNVKEKLVIARDYLLPEILAQYNINPTDIKFPIQVIETIIHRVAPEEGVRNLKRGLESIVSWANMHRYVPPEDSELNTTFPLTVTEDHIHKYLHVSEAPGAMHEEVARMMYI